MVFKQFTEMDNYNDSTVRIVISSWGSRFHWVKQVTAHGIAVVEQGFASTLLTAVFESEI
jgi:hypothetical protein